MNRSDSGPRRAKGVSVVTGGMGLVGSAIARQLASTGEHVKVVDIMLPGGGAQHRNVAAYADEIEIHRVDVRDRQAMIEICGGAGRVFHCAAHTSHVGSMEDPYLDLDVNTRGTLSLLDACLHAAPAAVVVLAGTRQVYGRPRQLPVSETHPVSPPDINGIHLHAAEEYARLYASVHGLKTVVARLTNVYGPGLRVRDARQMFLGIWIRRVLEGAPLDIFGDGSQRRDLVYVEDAARALIGLSAVAEAREGPTNVGSGKAVSLRELAELLVRIAGKGEIRRLPFPSQRLAIEIGDYVGDTSRLEKLLGWRPATSLDVGLRATVDYYREHLTYYIDNAA